jgi:hypothetical protein
VWLEENFGDVVRCAAFAVFMLWLVVLATLFHHDRRTRP